jgi:adenosylhomocysteinase
MADISISSNDRAQRLYDTMIGESGLETSRYSLVVVQHVLPNSLPLFKALRAHFHISAIIPKPKSIDSSSLDQLENFDPPIPILHCRREQLLDRDYINTNIACRSGDRSLVLLDIGGYFAGSIDILSGLTGNRFAGIVEDTENGHQKYDAYVEPLKQRKGEMPCPIFSVARSPLKEPEDHLVGQSVLYSAERVLREHNTLLTNKIVLVIGYGKIGKSIASSLAVRNVTVWVFDRDPIRCAQALAHGFHVPDRNFGISHANLIIGATGNKSLSEEDFGRLRPYSFVCSVTSADDEFDFGNLRNTLPNRKASNGTEIYYNGNKLFHLLNEGNAINFVHGAVLGMYIYLVACEIIECVLKIIRIKDDFRKDRIMTLTTTERQSVANRWVQEFKNADV